MSRFPALPAVGNLPRGGCNRRPSASRPARRGSDRSCSDLPLRPLDDGPIAVEAMAGSFLCLAASLAGVVVTPLLKRRQQVLKPRNSLEMLLMLKPSLSFERGQHRRDRQWRGIVGSAGVLERGKGTGW